MEKRDSHKERWQKGRLWFGHWFEKENSLKGEKNLQIQFHKSPVSTTHPSPPPTSKL